MADYSAEALLYIATHPGSTTTDVGKAIFEPESDKDLRNADRKVRYYFTEKYPELVEKASDSSPATYRVKDDHVYAGLARMEVDTFDGEEISIGLGGTVVYVDSEGDLNIETVGEVAEEGEGEEIATELG